MKIARVGFILLALMFGLLDFPRMEARAQEVEAEQGDQDEQHSDWLDLWTRVQKIRLDRMQEFLKLDKEKMNRMTPHLNRIDTKKREVGKERLFLMRTLKKRTQEGANDAQLGETLHRLEENHAALDRLKQEQDTLLKAHLTMDQQAKYILFQRAFKEELRDLIQKERNTRR